MCLSKGRGVRDPPTHTSRNFQGPKNVPKGVGLGAHPPSTMTRGKTWGNKSISSKRPTPMRRGGVYQYPPIPPLRRVGQALGTSLRMTQPLFSISTGSQTRHPRQHKAVPAQGVAMPHSGSGVRSPPTIPLSLAFPTPFIKMTSNGTSAAGNWWRGRAKESWHRMQPGSRGTGHGE